MVPRSRSHLVAVHKLFSEEAKEAGGLEAKDDMDMRLC